MQVNIESPHLQIADDLQNKVLARFNHLEKFYDRITGCDVVLRKINNEQQNNCEIEARVLIPKSSFFAREQAATFESALDRVIENLVRQLKREKEERQELL